MGRSRRNGNLCFSVSTPKRGTAARRCRERWFALVMVRVFFEKVIILTQRGRTYAKRFPDSFDLG
jgi:hypothetical protein